MVAKNIRKGILVVIAVLTVAFVALHYDGHEYSRDNIEEYVDRMCELYNVPGLSAAVMDGENEYYINYGDSIDEHSRYQLASTTKSFTAQGILTLEKAGRLKISDPVTDYLPWFTPTYKGEAYNITIEDLMCHTSGIPVWTITTIPVGEGTEEGLLKRTIENISNVELDSKPGTHHEYATINYDVLALIIEEVTGQKCEDYLKTVVLDPLDMGETFFWTSDADSDKIVTGHKKAFFLPHKYDAPIYYGNTAAGYLVSNTSDLMKWIKHWAVESEDETGLVGSVLDHYVGDSDNYYAGWYIYGDLINHGGNNPNFSSQVIISRKKQQGVFVLSNLAGSSATNVADGIYRLLLGENVKIGFQLDTNGLEDFLAIVVILLLIYFSMLLWDKWSKGVCVVRIIIGLAFIAAAHILPEVLHYPYSSILVWLPITVFVAVAFAFAVALNNVVAGFRILVARHGSRK